MTTRHYFSLYILKQSLTRKQVPSDAVAWKKTVLAESRSQAVDKCRNEIIEFVTAEIVPTDSIGTVSVFVGRKGVPSYSASRLDPIKLKL